VAAFVHLVDLFRFIPGYRDVIFDGGGLSDRLAGHLGRMLPVDVVGGKPAAPSRPMSS
jgi:hypothetical protein